MSTPFKVKHGLNVTGSGVFTGSVIATSFVGDGSGLTGISLPSGILSSSAQISSDISGSFTSDSSSFSTRVSTLESNPTTYISQSGQDATFGDITTNNINANAITADELYITEITRSILQESGSTNFGDTLDDTHTFTGSVDITGSITADGNNLSNVSVVKKTGVIDWTSNGTTNIYTVPSNSEFLIDGFDTYTIFQSGSSGEFPTASIGTTSDNSQFISETGLQISGSGGRHVFGNPQNVLFGGETISVTVISGSTHAGHTGRVLVKGILIGG